MPYGDSSINQEEFYIAGLVGAVQNNMQGISGTAPRIQLMILKVRDIELTSRHHHRKEKYLFEW